MVDRNWRTRQGEIDLVLRRPGVIVFSEVKTRTTTAFGAPFEAVTPTKQARLRRLAAEWLRAHPGGTGGSGQGDGAAMGGALVAGPAAGRRIPDIRFDVVSVRGEAVDVIESAF